MRKSSAIHDSSRTPKTTPSRVVSDDGCDNGEDSSASTVVKPNACAHVPAHIGDTGQDNYSVSEIVPSEHPAAEEVPQAENKTTFDPEDQCREILLRLYGKKRGSGSPDEEIVVEKLYTDSEKTKNLNLREDPSLQSTKHIDDLQLPRNSPPSHDLLKGKVFHGTQSKKSPPLFKKTNQPKHKLAQESTKELETFRAVGIKPKSMRIVETTWNRNYESLVLYHSIHGDSNVLRSNPDKQLSGWVKRQRDNLKDGKLSPLKILLLNKLNFVWNRMDSKWDDKFNSLVRFEIKFGHCNVTNKYDRSLAEWTQRQRREYRNGTSTMTNARVQKLEALKGWSWEKLKLRKEAAKNLVSGNVQLVSQTKVKTADNYLRRMETSSIEEVECAKVLRSFRF